MLYLPRDLKHLTVGSPCLMLEIANCYNFTIVLYLLGNFGQAMCIRSCHEDLVLTRKSHNCAGIAFIQGDSAGGSKVIEQTLQFLKKNCMLPTFEKSTFCGVSTEKMMDRQYRENGSRNIYSNYNQMRAYIECSPNQLKKLDVIDLSIEQSTKL